MAQPNHEDLARVSLEAAAENQRTAGQGYGPHDEGYRAKVDAAQLTALIGIGHALLAVAQQIRRARP